MVRSQNPGGESSSADVTAERVREVIAAAEAAAAGIIADAQAEADRIRAAADAESEATVEAANREATGTVEQARGAVEGLIAQADKLRGQVGALGKDLASNMPGRGRESVEETVAPQEPEAVGAPRSPAAAADRTPGPEPESNSSDQDAAAGDAAARLVAMNMALDGASRADIASRLESEFPAIGDLDPLLDDVLSRAGR